ncbi:MAG TPA: hypothetical protein VEF04_01040 [Blastocatellia bacterium]|nr:hypothetical protein [Blastocatellia bacterium]
MQTVKATHVNLDPQRRAFYSGTLKLLNESKVDYLVGGAYAFARYTGIERDTKDFDIFVRPKDCARILEVLKSSGCETELTFPHWLGKAYCGEDFFDVIYSSGNAVAEVDDEWFENAVDGIVLDVPVKLCPAEEIIWSKAFVMERERYDGADIAHLLRACATDLDWHRLLRRFGQQWRVLLSHLVLFGFAYPAERNQIPNFVLDNLLQRLQNEMHTAPPTERVCQGTLISRAQYLIDLERWGYQDSRLKPRGKMSKEEITHWTLAISKEK